MLLDRSFIRELTFEPAAKLCCPYPETARKTPRTATEIHSVVFYARQCFGFLNPAFDSVNARYFGDVFLLTVNIIAVSFSWR